MCNVKPERMCDLFIKFITVSYGLRIIFCTFHDDMWLTPVMSFKQVPGITYNILPVYKSEALQ